MSVPASASLSEGCSEGAVATAFAKLKPAQQAAIRWSYANFNGNTSVAAGAAAGISLNSTIRLVRFLAKSICVSHNTCGGKVDRAVVRWFSSCDGDADGHLTLPELSWVMHHAGGAWLMRRAFLLNRAEELLSEMRSKARKTKREPLVCRSEAAQNLERVGEVRETRNKLWRYYTAFPCSGSKQICLTFKSGVNGRQLLGLRLADGWRAKKTGSVETLIGVDGAFDWEEGMFSHNVALLQTSAARDEFVMLGGTQGFVTNRSCTSHIRRFNRRRWCLVPDTRPGLPEVSARAAARGTDAVLSGVRLTRGRGWRWRHDAWSEPRVVLHGNDPPGCIDRRPEYTGYHPAKPPEAAACEFDGRLSVVRLASDGSGYRVYARANRAYGAVAGGRGVQTTSSPDLEGNWTAWQPVTFRGINPNLVDLYFVSVMVNPIEPTTLMAIFPVSEPPWACIAAAFSRDGVKFSSPINLHNSRVAFRQNVAHSAHDQFAADQGFTARGEDHPVAGIVPDPTAAIGGTTSDYLLYYHHAVRGFSYQAAESHVAAYRLPAARLRDWTTAALAELDRGEVKRLTQPIYALVSAPNFQANVLAEDRSFERWGGEVVHGAVVTQLYLKLRSAKTGNIVRAAVHADQFAAFRVFRQDDDARYSNRTRIVLDDLDVLQMSGGRFVTHAAGWEIFVNRRKLRKPLGRSQGLLASGEEMAARWYLDISARVLDNSPKEAAKFGRSTLGRIAPHGVLGQSVDGSETIDLSGTQDKYGDDTPYWMRGSSASKDKANKQPLSIEGKHADYLVAKPFATAFRFSRFDSSYTIQ